MKTVNLFAVTSLFVLIIAVVLHAQPPEVEWDMTYWGGRVVMAYSVQQTTDGGYIFAGVRAITYDDPGDVILAKTNSFGVRAWTRYHGGSSDEEARSLQLTLDGGYILAGMTRSFGAGETDLYLVKTNTIGDTMWNRTYGGQESDYARSVRLTADGGYIIAGYARLFGASFYEFYLVKTDSTGDTLWTRTYGGSNHRLAYDVQQTTDGGYIIAGCNPILGAIERDIFLVKTDSTGSLVWSRTYGGNELDMATSVQQTTDGGYILAGITESFGAGNRDIYVIKTDSQGDTLWTQTYGGLDDEGGASILQTADGGYIIRGNTSSFGAVRSDLYLVRTDYQGDTLWTLVYGGTDREVSCSIQNTNDHGYIIAGYVYDNYEESYRGWLVKIGPDTFIYHPEIQVSDSLLNFEEVMVLEDSSLGLTVYNMGNTNLVIYDVTTSDSIFFTNYDPSDSLISPGDSLVITVTFAPWDTLHYNEILSIDNNDELLEVGLAGIGLPPNSVALVPSLKIPTNYALDSIYPNPFNAQATIRYDLPFHGRVLINVYDVLGRKALTLVDEFMNAGRYRTVWDAGDLPSGIYFCRMNSGDFDQIQKILLLK